MKLATLLLLVASSALASDVRYRRPSTHWIPGFYEGRYAGESNIATLPDVIVATLQYLSGAREVQSLVPVRTLEKL